METREREIFKLLKDRFGLKRKYTKRDFESLGIKPTETLMATVARIAIEENQEDYYLED